jgi:O-antigen/teichoic acid export membrane protein
MGALLLGSIVNCSIGFMAMRKMLVHHGPVAFDKKLILRLLYLAAPFAIAMLCIKANAYTDTILVKALLNDTAVGLYSVAYKITFAFQFIPMAFVASLYPAFTSLWHHDKEKLPVTFINASTCLLIFSVPIVAIIAGAAHVIVPMVYRTEYSGSVMPLVILCSSLPLLFINFPIGSLLNAIGRQSDHLSQYHAHSTFRHYWRCYRLAGEHSCGFHSWY